MGEAGACPVCQGKCEHLPDLRRGDLEEYDCERCGRFGLTGTVLAELPDSAAKRPLLRRILCHAIRRMQRSAGRPTVAWSLLEHCSKEGRLPTPVEQVENLLLWIGENISAGGEQIEITDAAHGGIIGTASPENFFWLVDHLISEKLVLGRHVMGGRTIITPSYAGWERLDEIRTGHAEAKKVFMAMQYGDAALDDVLARCFRPAVEATGFRLERLDDRPRAGLIDDRLRIEIRTSRFLVADLTAENRGAYWEAGFAEGLGKPVIYTCEKGHFDKLKTHFDTNHHLTVPWDKANLDDAGERLKATIRATLPAEAKLTDE